MRLYYDPITSSLDVLNPKQVSSLFAVVTIMKKNIKYTDLYSQNLIEDKEGGISR